MQIDAPRAPWVDFRTIAEEDRQASIDKGSYVAKDVDYAFITPAGSKDCIEKPVADWFQQLKEQVENGRFPEEWLRNYQHKYQQWNETGEIPVIGTAVKNWAVASPAQVEMLLKLHVRTVEQLAGANEEVIGRLGMGARSLVDKAKAYVEQQESGVGKLVEENAALKQQAESSAQALAAQAEQLKVLQAQVEALRGGIGLQSAQSASTDDTTANQLESAIKSSDLLDSAKPAARPL